MGDTTCVQVFDLGSDCTMRYIIRMFTTMAITCALQCWSSSLRLRANSNGSFRPSRIAFRTCRTRPADDSFPSAQSNKNPIPKYEGSTTAVSISSSLSGAFRLCCQPPTGLRLFLVMYKCLKNGDCDMVSAKMATDVMYKYG